MIAFLCGGMTVGELCNTRPNLRGAIREYFEFFGKGMEGGKMQTLEHKVNGKVVWILDFQDFSGGKVESLNDVYRFEVIEFQSIEG